MECDLSIEFDADGAAEQTLIAVLVQTQDNKSRVVMD
tara:strand:- start:307 stop:417 length:111 start_codon:yes stop_codon:yes gene_type:complete